MFYFIKKTINTYLVFIFLFVLISSCSQNKDHQIVENMTSAEVTLFSTEKRIIHSEIINDDFEIYISLPYLYSKTDTKYPVLYSLDANVKFGMISNVVNNLGTLTQEIPEIIVVGIAYPISGLEDWIIGRNRDLTPTRKSEHEDYWEKRLSKVTGRNDIVVESGHADKFIAFIRDELIPFIESNYRVSSKDRALHGTSLGGLFTLYALFQYPELFQRYFAGSPSIDWDENFMFKLENDFALSHKDLPVKLFMCVGGLERTYYLTNLKKMDELLRSRKYPNLEIESHIFENETHGTTVSSSLGRGLKSLYEK
jgi:predicted alpha/beta superfamily hydrolase